MHRLNQYVDSNQIKAVLAPQKPPGHSVRTQPPPRGFLLRCYTKGQFCLFFFNNDSFVSLFFRLFILLQNPSVVAAVVVISMVEEYFAMV